MLTIYLNIFLLLVLLFLSGFFSGSETALFSLSKVQIEKLVQIHPKNGKKIRDLIERPRRLIITILLGNEFVNIAISTISAGLIIRITGSEVPWSNIFIVLPILLLFGEITPKTLAIRNNEKFSNFVATPLSIFSRWITPVRWIIRNISDRRVKFQSILYQVKDGNGDVIWKDSDARYIEGGMIEPLGSLAFASHPVCKREAKTFELIIKGAEVLGK